MIVQRGHSKVETRDGDTDDVKKHTGFSDIFSSPGVIEQNQNNGGASRRKSSVAPAGSPPVTQSIGNAAPPYWRTCALNSTSLILPICLLVFVIILWTNDLITSPEDKAIWSLYTFAGFITSITMIYSYVDNLDWTLFEALEFRSKNWMNMTVQLTNCYSDLAILYGYIDRSELEFAIILSLAMFLYRMFSAMWVWSNFHSLFMVYLQSFELLTIHESVRSFSKRVNYVSSLQIGIYEIVLEDLPSIILVLTSIGRGTLDFSSFAVWVSLITSFGSITLRNVSFDSLQMQKNRLDENKINYVIHHIFRLSETCGRLAVLTFVYMVSWIFLLVLLVVESSVVFLINKNYTNKKQNQCIKYSLHWFVNLPVLSKESLGYHLAGPKRREIDETNKLVRGSHFQQIFEAVNKRRKLDPEWTYKLAVKKTLEKFKTDEVVHVTLDGGRRHAIKKPTLEVPPPFSTDFPYSCPFVILALGFRMVSNIILLIICRLVLLEDIYDVVEDVLTGFTVTCSVLMILGLFWLLKEDCILPEGEGKQYVTAPFKRRMSWSELLDAQQEYMWGNSTANLIAYIENYVITGKNVMEPNQKGEIITTKAARLGLKSVTEICMKAGLDMNKADLNGYTPLIMMQAMGRVELVRFILEDPRVDPNKCTSGGQKVPPLIAAAYDPETMKDMVVFLCSKGANIDFENKTGNIFHAIFNLTIGQWGFTHKKRTELLEIIIEEAKKKGVEQKMLDYRRRNYQSIGANFPQSVLDRLVWNNKDSDEDNLSYVDFMLKQGATVSPSFLAGLLECDKFDFFEHVFTHSNNMTSLDKIEILSQPWHGGSFEGYYEGPSPDDPLRDFCVTMILSPPKYDTENPTTTRLTFTESFKFKKGEVPYSCKLAKWDSDEDGVVDLLLSSKDIWFDLCVKSIDEECMEDVEYEDVKQRLEKSQKRMNIKLSMGSGYQRQLCNMLKMGGAPGQFVDLTREILEESSEPVPFLRRLNKITSLKLESSQPPEALQKRRSPTRGMETSRAITDGTNSHQKLNEEVFEQDPNLSPFEPEANLSEIFHDPNSPQVLDSPQPTQDETTVSEFEEVVAPSNSQLDTSPENGIEEETDTSWVELQVHDSADALSEKSENAL